jgi:hypothetical protein
MLRFSSERPQGALHRTGVYKTQMNYHIDSKYNLTDNSFGNFNACVYVASTY